MAVSKSLSLAVGMMTIRRPSFWPARRAVLTSSSCSILGSDRTAMAAPTGIDFVHQLHLLCRQGRVHHRQSCDIGVRPVEAVDETLLHWVSRSNEHYRNGGGGGHGCTCRRCAAHRCDHCNVCSY